MQTYHDNARRASSEMKFPAIISDEDAQLLTDPGD